MIALSGERRKGRFANNGAANAGESSGGHTRHGNVSGIIMPPHFRPAPAVLDCDKSALRWPGPFGSGFLSPQPPGIVGIGPSAVNTGLGPTKVGPFLFLAPRSRSSWPVIGRHRSPNRQIAPPESAFARSLKGRTMIVRGVQRSEV